LQDGTTPLSAASQSGHVEVVDCLIKNGAKVDEPDKVNNYECLHISRPVGSSRGVERPSDAQWSNVFPREARKNFWMVDKQFFYSYI